MSFHIPSAVRQFAEKLTDGGFQCFLVGGAVRNMIMGRNIVDYDVATDALPNQVQHVYKRVIPTGIKHGTVTVLYQNKVFEVTTFRTETGYSDGRRPDTVAFSPSIEIDLKRRDFTMNGIALNVKSGELLDPCGGRIDIARKTIRAIGNADQRFSEDGLRLLRACRFATQLQFEIEDSTFRGMCRNSSLINAISAERIQEELEKIFLSKQPSIAFRLMQRTGLLGEVLQELENCVGVSQKGRHDFDVFEHSLIACDGAPQDNLAVRIAALFHDIGKPAAKKQTENGEVVFYHHEEISRELSEIILRRLKFSNSVIREVTQLIQNHMFSYDSSWTDAAVRRFLKRVGPENVSNLFLLRSADSYGMQGKIPQTDGLREFRQHIDRIIEEKAALTVADLAINGNDLAEEAEIPKGPEMGFVFDFLMEAVLDDPKMNTRTSLLKMATRYYRDRLSR